MMTIPKFLIPVVFLLVLGGLGICCAARTLNNHGDDGVAAPHLLKNGRVVHAARGRCRDIDRGVSVGYCDKIGKGSGGGQGYAGGGGKGASTDDPGGYGGTGGDGGGAGDGAGDGGYRGIGGKGGAGGDGGYRGIGGKGSEELMETVEME
ncbi:hypothetical protein AAHE18_01G059000 [Arachis hypogaea]